MRGPRHLAAVAAAVLLAGCSGVPPQCAPCPASVYVNILLGGATPGATPGRAAFGLLRVCVEGRGCSRVRGPVAKGMASLPLSVDTPAEEADGWTVTAVLRTTRHGETVIWAGRTRLRYTDGGDGVCSCSYSTGQIDLTRQR